MRRSLYSVAAIASLLTLSPEARALSPAQRLANRDVRQAVIQYYQQGNSTLALAYLQTSLATDRGKNRDVAVAEELATIAYVLKGERQISGAYTAAAAAVNQLNSLAAGVASNAEVAHLSVTCGALCERILKDDQQAVKFYQVAVTVMPSIEGANGLLTEVLNKLKGHP